MCFSLSNPGGMMLDRITRGCAGRVISVSRRLPEPPVMSTEPSPPPPLNSSHDDHLFPTLTAAQSQRIERRGSRRPIAAGEVLVDAGDAVVPFFVVVSGEVQAMARSGADESIIVTLGPGQF